MVEANWGVRHTQPLLPFGALTSPSCASVLPALLEFLCLLPLLVWPHPCSKPQPLEGLLLRGTVLSKIPPQLCLSQFTLRYVLPPPFGCAFPLSSPQTLKLTHNKWQENGIPVIIEELAWGQSVSKSILHSLRRLRLNTWKATGLV